MKWMPLAAVLVALAGGTAAQAGTPMVGSMTCPVGGGTITYVGTGSYSTWGSRPDGKPYSSWTSPLPLPECPDNGLVVYRDFSTEEIARLPAILASPEYRTMIGRDASYYRAYRLERTLNPGGDATGLLYRAAWQVDNNPERKAAYQRELIARFDARPRAPEDIGWLSMEFRAVNALRELGEFDAALSRLKGLPMDALKVGPPKDAGANTDAMLAARSRGRLLALFTAMEAVILRRDASPEPLDLIPARVVAGTCMDASDPATLQPPGICERPDVVSQIKLFREMRELLDKP